MRESRNLLYSQPRVLPFGFEKDAWRLLAIEGRLFCSLIGNYFNLPIVLCSLLFSTFMPNSLNIKICV